MKTVGTAKYNTSAKAWWGVNEIQIQQFMEENDIAIFVKADLNTNEFVIVHGNLEMGKNPG